MSNKEAKARIKINNLLTEAGWRFFDTEEGPANIRLELNIKLTQQAIDELGENFEKTKNGFADYLLLDERGNPFIVLEAKKEDINPLSAKEQARKYALNVGAKYIILSNGDIHYFWNLEKGNPELITAFPTYKSLIKSKALNSSIDALVSMNIDKYFIALSQDPSLEGKCADGSMKFVYYNTNIHKDAEIADTIGASDYTFDVSPTEITDSLFDVPSNWHQMRNFLNEFKGANSRGFVYSGERLTMRRMESYYSYVVTEFYKEDGKVVCDLYYLQDEGTPEERKILFYSTSDRYEVIYNCYGDDVTDYFDISQTVEQSTKDENIMLLEGHAELKELPGTVVYTQIKYRAEYSIVHNGKITSMVKNDQINNQTTINQSYLIDKIEGVDHTQTAKFTVYDYYILYEKNIKTE